MRISARVLALGILLAAGCARETPVRLEEPNLGIVAVFPGRPRMHKFSETTPFGEMEWFSTTYETPGRLDRSFFVDVGNLPPGDQGGSTESEILGTMRRFLAWKMGPVEAEDLTAERGPGFHYAVALPNGGHSEGIVVLKRGRIHRAQATVAKSEDPQARAFLESFEVLP